MLKILLVVLGCNIASILNDRLETSFKHIESIMLNLNLKHNQDTFEISNKLEITWFLSGGIKNNFIGAKSEASIMKSQIDNIINLKYLSDSKSNQFFLSRFIIDDKSTNTAENFIRASDYLNSTLEQYDSIYIITSDFHYNRANKMLSQIDSSRKYDWILGKMENSDSRYWESVHIKNVESDVNRAFGIINQ